ncbi:MAG: helicase-related protein [Selenomonadaceae bacterium]|nr:helicase-related protein [Selenomonadaceae bacterium]
MKEQETVRAIEIRQEFVRRIKAQMLGPGAEGNVPDAEHEVLSASPFMRYTCGVLYPQNFGIREAEQAEKAESAGSAEADDAQEPQPKAEEKIDDAIKIDGAVDDGDEDLSDSDNAAPEEGINLNNSFFQSSFGLCFLVRGDTSSIRCQLDVAKYRKAGLADCCYPDTEKLGFEDWPLAVRQYMRHRPDGMLSLVKAITWKDDIKPLRKQLEEAEEAAPPEAFNLLGKFCDQLHKGYVRQPWHGEFHVDFGAGETFFEDEKQLAGIGCKITALRSKLQDGSWSVSVIVVNNSKYDKVPKADKFVFQPSLEIRTEDNPFIFLDRSSIMSDHALDDEEWGLNLLYRNKRIYASGMGTSPGWEVDASGHGKIYSDFFPMKEVPPMDYALVGRLEGREQEILSMKKYAGWTGAGRQECLNSMRSLIDAYCSWIGEISKEAEILQGRLGEAAQANLGKCHEAASRMRAGIELLSSNDKAWQAFVLANKAMFMQQAQKIAQKANASSEADGQDEATAAWLEKMDYEAFADTVKWRSFQLAFILLSIPGIVEEKSKDRDLVDLIWFPTGGGKTEAYLGLSAFVIFYRRLAYPDDYGGTNVMMRYTLRMLTSQQFTRAATMICACELLRRQAQPQAQVSRFRRAAAASNPLGDEPITIGLWIGSAQTPNKASDASKELDDLIQGKRYANNHFQLLKCPWCGTDMVPKGKKAIWGYAKDGKHVYFTCPQPACAFHGGKGKAIPASVVDEDLYDQPPTLLIGTVDKFAMLAWDERGQNFFTKNGRGPELIIQDELHLISGPLGSIVGLYETAIEALAEHNGHRPKIIASTATIRRAKEQCAALYDRDVRQFPAPGIDAGDSFFARESKLDHARGRYGRLYCGIMSSGRQKDTVSYRMMADVLESAELMSGLTEQERDRLWTVVSYYNNLKELGRGVTMVNDDVKVEIRQLAHRFMRRRSRTIGAAQELTSRVKSGELVSILDRLEKVTYTAQHEQGTPYPINIVMCTNMISVGIDVDRLNVMLMNGQPIQTSEYIQASSRVGRSLPGVVFTLYDKSRSRDRSYYEQFKQYHESFYRFVEPTAATPFAKPARDRALKAVLAIILRSLPELQKDKDAINFDEQAYSRNLEELQHQVLARVHDIRQKTDWHGKDDSSSIVREMQQFFHDWASLAKDYREAKKPFIYGRARMMDLQNSEAGRLFKPFGTPKDEVLSFDALTSMRNVDSSVAGNVLIWEDEADGRNKK